MDSIRICVRDPDPAHGPGGYRYHRAMTSPVAPVRTSTLAVVGFIAAFIVPIAGLVIGIVARNQLKRPDNVEAGVGFARWAMIIGALGTAANVVFIVIWASLMARALSSF